MGLVACQQGLRDACCLVGEGHRDHPRQLTRKQLGGPVLAGIVLSRSADHRRGADNEQSPNIAMAALAYNLVWGTKYHYALLGDDVGNGCQELRDGACA